jgi:hypothetical protein
MSASPESDIEFLDYIESSAQRMADLSDENKDLQTKVAELSEQKVILEKVASAPVFADAHIDKLITDLGTARIIDPMQSEKVASLIKEDPQQILSLMEKLAEASTNYSAGEGIPSDSSDSDSDPDGWGQLTRKRTR